VLTRRRSARCLLVLIAALGPGAAPVSAEPMPVTTLRSGQTGRIAFATTTLKDRQFLRGEKEGAAATIWGDLKLPPQAAGRVPVVVLVHGTVGVGAREERWADELISLGVATFVLDSFRGRGISPPFESGGLPSPLAMIVDAYQALALLITHPRLDPGRVALMGFSRGGGTALYASLKRFQRLHGPTGAEYSAYLPFYPGCMITYIDDERVADRPIRLHQGTADNNLPIAACRDYVGRLQRAGKDAQLTEYPGAHHAFDSPDLPPAVVQPKALNWTRCRFFERPDGELVNPETERPFKSSDPCFLRGPTVGYSAAAHADAIRAVKAFVTATFKLGP
jgi:dienelactone hydrolase